MLKEIVKVRNNILIIQIIGITLLLSCGEVGYDEKRTEDLICKEIELISGVYRKGEISSGEVKWYYYNVPESGSYNIYWDDFFEGSGSYTCDIKVSAYQEDKKTSYYEEVNSGFTNSQNLLLNKNGRVYIKVDGYYRESCSGSYAIMIKPSTHQKRYWTVMIYGDGDNDLEEFLLIDIRQMKNGYMNGQGMDVIVIIDRIEGYSHDYSVLNSNFSDTRLYKIANRNVARISGGSDFPEITKDSNYEANMGDAETLRKFVKSCKTNYPAEHYALIIWNHGGGVRSRGGNRDNRHYKAVCWDDTNENDCLYTAEITDVLTGNESVDLLGFDACFMGSVEVAYQYRRGNGGFNADVMVASPALEWGQGWDYENIFKRIRSSSGKNGETGTVTGASEQYYNSASLTAIQLGGIIVEEQYDSSVSAMNQVLSCYDLKKVENVKKAVDTMARSIYAAKEKDDFENVRGESYSQSTMHYFNIANDIEWSVSPFFDLFDLCEMTTSRSGFNNEIQHNASMVMDAVDEMIIYSFGGSEFMGFVNGKNGISIFFPDGDRLFDGYRHWEFQWWYNSIDTDYWWSPDSNNGNRYYGKLGWCIDDAIVANRNVENWFEMLDAWFDYTEMSWPFEYGTYPYGGLNGYEW